MIITRLEDGGGRVSRSPLRNKIKIYIDGEYSFTLYGYEVRELSLKENMELPPLLYQQINEEILWKRIRRKSLDMLKRSDKSEHEIRLRLKQDGYSEELISKTTDWLKGYGYIDDRRFTEHFVAYKKAGKSSAQIRSELYKKGIQKEYIEDTMEQCHDDSDAIIKIIQKKTNFAKNLSTEEKTKLASYLYRKGFKNEDIRRHLDLYDIE